MHIAAVIDTNQVLLPGLKRLLKVLEDKEK
jgi:fumarate hydratase class II